MYKYPRSVDKSADTGFVSQCQCGYLNVEHVRQKLIKQHRWARLTAQNRYRVLMDEKGRHKNTLPLCKENADLLHAYLNVKDTIKSLVENPYWTRVWILQEVVLASKVEMLAMSQNLEMKNILNILEYKNWIHEGRLKITVSPGHKIPLTACLSPTNGYMLTRGRGRAENGSNQYDFNYLTALSIHRGCSDARDRVFGILSLIRYGEKFVVDYDDSALMVYTKVVRFQCWLLEQSRAVQSLEKSSIDIAHKISLAAVGTHAALRLDTPSPTVLPKLSEVLDSIFKFDVHPNAESFWASIDESFTYCTGSFALCTTLSLRSSRWLIAFAVVPRRTGPESLQQSEWLLHCRHCAIWELVDRRWKRRRPRFHWSNKHFGRCYSDCECELEP